MKRILLVSRYEPSNSGAGVQKRLFNHIQALERYAKVDLVVTGPVPTKESWITGNKRLLLVVDILKTLWQKEQFLYNNYAVDQIKLHADSFLAYDIVYFFRVITGAQLASLPMRKLLSGQEIWIDFDDIESEALGRANTFLRSKNGFLTNLLNLARIRAYKSLENRLMALADKVVVCSDKDRLQLEKKSEKAKVLVIPNIINLESAPRVLSPSNSESRQGDTVKILFVGTMSYDPNIDAVNFFVNDILPLISARSNSPLELLIVGFDPPEQIRSLDNRHGITVTGGVDSVASYYETCDFVIAPIRFGSGTRIKILEAYTFNRAVISTPLGCEGLDLEPGKDILIAETGDEFTEKCLSLINNPALSSELASNGAHKVKVNYSVERIAGLYKNMLNA